MDWALFSAQLRERQIPNLHELLASIDEDQIQALRVRDEGEDGLMANRAIIVLSPHLNLSTSYNPYKSITSFTIL